MQKKQFKIIYTSDVHGQLTGLNFATNTHASSGLSHLSHYLKTLKSPYLLLDNGDFLQGNVLLDYHRQFESDTDHPVASTMNRLGYAYLTLGNHDFNYGLSYLNQSLSAIDATVLCGNVLDQTGHNLFKSYHIHALDSGIRIGLVGAVTHYIPNWEKPEHIEGLCFINAYEHIKKTVEQIKPLTDLIIVLYHGGFERDLKTHGFIGRPTDENQGYQIAQLPEIDILLTGHQHVPMCVRLPDQRLVLQTGMQAHDFGEITLFLEHDGQRWMLEHMDAKIKPMTPGEDQDIVNPLGELIDKTQTYLDQKIGETQINMTINDPLSARSQKHPLFQLINELQLNLSHADISAASLPNDALGFKYDISLRDLAANFVYPNTFVKLEITGDILKSALERSAEYFTSINGVLTIDESFIYPKAEHYNVDIYDNITYIIDARKPKGSRIISMVYQDQPIQPSQKFTLILNSYRAVGGGDYPMFQHAKILETYDISLFDLIKNHILKVPKLTINLKKNYHIIN